MDCTIFVGEAKDVETRLREGVFHNYWNLSALAQSPLADCSLASDCLLAGDAGYPDALGYAVRATVDWALEKLYQREKHRFEQSYDVLDQRYRKGLTNAQYAKSEYIDERVAQARRKTAIERVVEILQQEVQAPREVEQRKQTMIALRYEDCQPDDQNLLRFLAIFREAVSVTLVADVEQIALQPHFARLLARNLLMTNEEATEIRFHPEIRPYLLTLLTADERGNWHAQAGSFYEQTGNLTEAAYHFQQAPQPQQAAELLIAHQDEIGKGLPIVPLLERLAEFQRADFSLDRWAQLKILAGRAAEVSKELDVAQRAYEEALAAEDDAIKAEAYYWLARLYEQRDMNVAFMHYESCKTLFRGLKRAKSVLLLANAYIRSAWLYIEKSSQFKLAKVNLREVEPILEACEGKEGDRLRSDYHSTWGTLYARQTDSEPEVQRQHYWQAWKYARQGEDMEQLINTAYNLGSMYFLQAQYDEAQSYWEESLRLAIEACDQRMVALSNKGIGSCYVSGPSDYQTAVTYYMDAYAYFEETKNDYWKSFVCYDLAEAHAELGDAIVAKGYFDKASQTTEVLGNSRWIAELAALREKYPELTDELNDRQRQVIGYIRRNKSIKRNEYENLTGIKKRMAVNDLKDLLEKGICAKGKGWSYELAPQYQDWGQRERANRKK